MFLPFVTQLVSIAILLFMIDHIDFFPIGWCDLPKLPPSTDWHSTYNTDSITTDLRYQIYPWYIAFQFIDSQPGKRIFLSEICNMLR